ncbi:MAG: NADH:ubiquinone reductase (Na(+)-transporting) subunit A, partial [Bacteroidales bacterium]|nr:NADH:ubiquinone reductase (Na(+)-transporting) subunit A [Bacteroidales bacterium]
EAIVRGARRALQRIVIKPSQPLEFIEKLSRVENESVIEKISRAGLWGFLRQRPYNIVPKTTVAPRDIFVTLINKGPLESSREKDFAACQELMTAAVKALQPLTKGNIYIGRTINSPVKDIDGAIMVDVDGPYPTGNVGVIASNIKPVNKGEIIWTMDGETLCRIGSLMTSNSVNWSNTVTVAGSEVKNPGNIDTVIGADIASILNNRLNPSDHHIRIISGNILSGIKVTKEEYLRFPYKQVSVIPEGDDKDEFMGWASVSPSKMSTSRSFPGHFLFKKLFNPDARLLGGRRALIMSGEYDRVVPMDIMTEYLIKAILSRDIEKMEALGIYEVAPEDFAAAEYVCTSKIPIQSIIAEGLDYLRKELE